MEMTFGEMAGARLMVAAKGGTIEAMHGKETLWELGLAAGIHEAKQFQQYMSADMVLVLREGVTAVTPGQSRLHVIPYGPKGSQSGANPDFKPQRLNEQEAELRRTLERAKKTADRLEQREATMTRLIKERGESVVDQEDGNDDEAKEREAAAVKAAEEAGPAKAAEEAAAAE